MTEKYPSSLAIVDIKTPSPTERVMQLAGQVAHGFELDPVTTEALVKFAVANYRIGIIKDYFVGTITSRILYRTDFWQEHTDFAFGTMIKRTDYAEKINMLSTTAFNLYSEYLSHDDSSIAAVREVQWTIGSLFPKPLKKASET